MGIKVKCIYAKDFHPKDELHVGDILEVEQEHGCGGRFLWTWKGKCGYQITASKSRFELVVEGTSKWDTANDMLGYPKPQAPSHSPTKSIDISDWRAWQHRTNGDCPCGISKSQCSYHR